MSSNVEVLLGWEREDSGKSQKLEAVGGSECGQDRREGQRGFQCLRELLGKNERLERGTREVVATPSRAREELGSRRRGLALQKEGR